MAASMNCETVQGRFRGGELASVMKERQEAFLLPSSPPSPTSEHVDTCSDCQIALGQEIERRLDQHPLLAGATMGISVNGVEAFLRDVKIDPPQK
jgi:hypothetical protein